MSGRRAPRYIAIEGPIGAGLVGETGEGDVIRGEDDDLLDGEGRFNLRAGLLNLGELIDASDSRGRGAGRATASTTSSLPEPKRTNHAGGQFSLAGGLKRSTQ